tara:strand:+ start:85 stop:525 length:441 start_codon:yes stop_codon:yes gene_type:complete
MSGDIRWSRLVRAIRQCDQWIHLHLADALEQFDLSERQFLFLELCALDERQLDQKQISDELSQSPSVTSGVVESLRARGFVELVRSSQDRRRQLPALTAEGLSFYQAANLATAKLRASSGLCEFIEALESIAPKLAEKESYRRNAA